MLTKGQKWTQNTRKAAKIGVVALMVWGMALAASKAQTLVLTGTLEQSLTDQELVQYYPLPGGADVGTISSWVVNDSTLDPSGYIFIYQVLNDGPDSIVHVELTGFPSAITTGLATYSAESGLALPDSVTPSASGNLPTTSLTGSEAANFDGGALPIGAASYFLVIDTDVYSIGDNYGQTLDSFSSAGDILAPVAVPEPASSLVLLAGFACLYGLYRYRRAARA